MKIVILGAGNLAWHLAPFLRKNGHEIVAVYSRTKFSAVALAKKVKAIPIDKIEDIPSNADIYIVALQDKAVRSVLKSLKFIPNCIAHTSGSVSISVFPKQFKNTGVFYPLQTFSKTRKVNLNEVPFLLESSNLKTKKILSSLANSISTNVHFITSDKRKKIHLAAVFANNFVNHLYSIASEILKESKLPFDLLKPLIIETAGKILEDSPEKMQTGPARRNDQEIIKSHLQLLKGQKNRKAIYSLLNASIIDKFKVKAK